MKITWTFRVVALLWLPVAAVVACAAALTMHASPASRAAHLVMLLTDVFGTAVVVGPVLWPGAAVRLLRMLGWLLPVALVWVGVEHFLDWTAFHRSGGPWEVRTPRQAQQAGACFVLAGAGLLAAYAAAMLAHHRRTADAVTPRADRLPELVVSPAR